MPKQQTDASRIKPDVLATIRLRSTDEGGRHLPTPAHDFGCIVELDHKLHECRLLLGGVGSIAPGGQADDVPIKFLRSDLIAHQLKVGINFRLQEGNTRIGDGTIKEVLI
jgi:hypothetical protein